MFVLATAGGLALYQLARRQGRKEAYNFVIENVENIPLDVYYEMDRVLNQESIFTSLLYVGYNGQAPKLLNSKSA